MATEKEYLIKIEGLDRASMEFWDDLIDYVYAALDTTGGTPESKEATENIMELLLMSGVLDFDAAKNFFDEIEEVPEGELENE